MTKPFIVTGCARSGTMGTAVMLNDLGVRTSFEEFFVARPFSGKSVLRGYREWLRETMTCGEVSGMAVPYLPWMMSVDVAVVHQVRNPVAVIASLMGLRNFHEETIWQPNVKFNFRHLPSLRRDATPLERCMQYWLGWNRLVENASPSLRVRAEDLMSPKTRQSILSEIMSDAKPDATPYRNTTNAKTRNSLIHWRTLPDGKLKEDIQKMALGYGYVFADLDSCCPAPDSCQLCGLNKKEGA